MDFNLCYGWKVQGLCGLIPRWFSLPPLKECAGDKEKKVFGARGCLLGVCRARQHHGSILGMLPEAWWVAGEETCLWLKTQPGGRVGDLPSGTQLLRGWPCSGHPPRPPHPSRPRGAGLCLLSR